MRHFIMLEQQYVPKNKACEAAQEVARMNDRLIMDDAQKYEKLEELRRLIKEINRSHPRSKPLNLDIRKYFGDTYITCETHDQSAIFKMGVYQAKN